MEDVSRSDQRWCILRTSGPRTLALVRSLSAAGFQVWTPRRTFRRPKPGKRVAAGARRATVEVEAPILPTFVFAAAAKVSDLHAAAADAAQPHGAFSIFQHGGRIPLIGGASVAGLVEAEREAQRLIEALRDADDRQERNRVRIAAMRTERARRKALRSERRDLLAGQAVSVKDAPALAGVTGIVQQTDGRSALVLFNGTLSMTIEAWRLVPDRVRDHASVIGAAA